MVAGALALPLLAVDEGAGDPAGERGRPEHEVDPHALAAGEAQLRVVPVRVDAGARGVRPDDVGVPGLDDAPEGGPLGRGDVRGVGEDRHVPHVVVLRRDVPVADQGDLRRRVLGQPAGSRRPQGLEPLELVLQVRVGQRAAVGHVQAPHPHAAAGGAERPRLGRRVQPLLRRPGRHAREADLDVLDAHPGQDRDPVPLRVADVGDLVPDRVEHHLGELVVPALGLLQRDDVDVAALQPGRHPVGSAADGVHVPGRQAHCDIVGLAHRQSRAGASIRPGLAPRRGPPCGHASAPGCRRTSSPGRRGRRGTGPAPRAPSPPRGRSRCARTPSRCAGSG